MEHMKYGVIFVFFLTLGLDSALAQPAQSLPKANANSHTTDVGIVRDPSSGRTYRREMDSVSVPVTYWEMKPVTRTVHEPTIVNQNMPVQFFYYFPRQGFVLEHKLQGSGNWLSPPSLTAEYRPVIQWVPAVQTATAPVPTQKWVARQQTTYEPQQVQTLQTRHQIVYTEIPKSGASAVPNGVYAKQTGPRDRIPLLAKQQASPSYIRQPLTPTMPVGWPENLPTNQSQLARSGSFPTGLRPVDAGSTSTGLPTTNMMSAPGSGPTESLARDPMQSGMAPTVLR